MSNVINVLFFGNSYVASKIETKEKVEEKITMRLNKAFSNWLIVRLNLSSDEVRNCKEATVFIKKKNPQFGVYTKTFIWNYKQLDKFGARKNHKKVKKVSKNRNGNKF